MRDTLLSRCDECGAEVHAVEGGRPPEKMRHHTVLVEGVVHPCPLEERRACDWCGGPLKENAKPTAETCGEKCRAARWKRRKGYGHRANGLGPRSGAKARSGRQVSYAKAVASVARELRRRGKVAPPTDEAARYLAEAMLRDALPERQRKDGA